MSCATCGDTYLVPRDNILLDEMDMADILKLLGLYCTGCTKWYCSDCMNVELDHKQSIKYTTPKCSNC